MTASLTGTEAILAIPRSRPSFGSDEARRDYNKVIRWHAVLATFALGLQVDWLQNHSTTVVAVDEAIFAIFLDVENVIDGAWVKK